MKKLIVLVLFSVMAFIPISATTVYEPCFECPGLFQYTFVCQRWCVFEDPVTGDVINYQVSGEQTDCFTGWDTCEPDYCDADCGNPY